MLIARVLLGTLILLSPCAVLAQESTQKTVLLLYSHEREAGTYTGLDHSLREALQAGAAYHTVFYTEYLDLMRFPDEQHGRQTVESLRVKYAGRRVDLIVVVSSLAFDFVMERAEEVFPGVPIVFTSVGVAKAQSSYLRSNVTGVAIKRDLRLTLELALRLQPDTTRVIVPVGTSSTEKIWAEDTRKLLQPYESRVAIDYLGDLSIDEMLSRLRHLEPRTIVLSSSVFFYDAAGDYFLPEETLERVSAAASVPVYGTNEPELGTGIVGGVLYDLAQSGAAAGRMGQRILAGAAPSSIPVETIDPNYNIFDARQLRRWNISMSRLPPGSVVRYQEQTVWERYKLYIVGALVVMALQSALIAGLIMLRAQGRRAEVAARASHARIQDLAHRLIAAQEAERTRIARELHDDAGQRLASFSITLSDVRRRSVGSPEQLPPELVKLEEQMMLLSDDLRLLSHEWHPRILEHLGLIEALRARCVEVAAESGIAVGLDVPPDLGDAMSDEVALCLYRVAQETLRNVAKHAQARRAHVSLSRHNGTVAMSVADDGSGFPADEFFGAQGLGLTSLNERVMMLGGTFAVTSSPGKGTTVSVTVPAGEVHAT